MLILLPPSEGKTPASNGPAIEWESLSFPELNPARAKVLEALGTVSAHEDALALLGVGASLRDDVERNTRLHAEPAAPAHQVYSGVLYDALGYNSMTPAQRRKATESILVVSALWGAIGFGDHVPAYRLSMGTALPDVGRLASYWKPQLNAALTQRAEGELLVDCRSSTYAAAWAPPATQTVNVNVFSESNGKRTVVSHFAKHTRGELARHLLTRRGKAPATPAQLAKAASEVWTTELVEGTARKPHALNIILPK
ncbi:peroxide stress protein YaaA [Paenarthrobacter nitroguajacolicus]|uniref:Peroxide stress protein YaaA n=1 Tax=Paenarthrobacter nitroguajacolicus TaxID=211146 RepID=A0A558GXD8_PAENT|nr:peroxide stress protein YaaA [Paenarthrobacter nitroguajacolicus]TVU61553.1 peroxide stress protein YaaA [Paenarthrobacter nitroguajacolicus]